MQFNIYRSTDVGAPVLRGISGGLTGVLAACLVNGYGSVSGAGWTMPYSSTSGAASGYAVFQQGSGNQFYLQVADIQFNAGGATFSATVTGYESMTSVTGGTNAFPTGGATAFFYKGTDTGTARPWIMFADNRSFYLFHQPGDSVGAYVGFFFGDVYSFYSGDGYRTALIGHEVNGSAQRGAALCRVSSGNSSISMHYMPRTYAGNGTAIQIGKHGDLIKGHQSILSGCVQYPNGPDSGLYVSPLWLVESANGSLRGQLRGMYQFCHPINNVSDGSTFSGTGPYAGKTFMIVGPIITCITGAATASFLSGSVACMETSNTLSTN